MYWERDLTVWLRIKRIEGEWSITKDSIHQYWLDIEDEQVSKLVDNLFSEAVEDGVNQIILDKEEVEELFFDEGCSYPLNEYNLLLQDLYGKMTDDCFLVLDYYLHWRI